MRRTLRLGTIACISEKLGLEFAGMDGRQLKLRVLNLQTRKLKRVRTRRRNRVSSVDARIWQHLADMGIFSNARCWRQVQLVSATH
jgi:hypothetical protein